MRFSLNITGENLQEIKTAVKKILDSHMDSNCGGWENKCHYNYFFTDTNDVWKDTDEMCVINPN